MTSSTCFLTTPNPRPASGAPRRPRPPPEAFRPHVQATLAAQERVWWRPGFSYVDRSGRAVSMISGPFAVPSEAVHQASSPMARTCRTRWASSCLAVAGRVAKRRPISLPSTNKPSQRQPSTVTQSIRGRQSIIVAGSPQSGHGPRVARKVRPAACRGFLSMAIWELVSGRGTPGSEGADRLQHSSRGRGASGRQSSERDLFDLELDHGGVGVTIPQPQRRELLQQAGFLYELWVDELPIPLLHSPTRRYSPGLGGGEASGGTGGRGKGTSSRPYGRTGLPIAH